MLTQPLNKRNSVALPSTVDATPSLAHAEYSPLILAWVVAVWEGKKIKKINKEVPDFSWSKGGGQSGDEISVTGTDQSLCEGKLMKRATAC